MFLPTIDHLFWKKCRQRQFTIYGAWHRKIYTQSFNRRTHSRKIQFDGNYSRYLLWIYTEYYLIIYLYILDKNDKKSSILALAQVMLLMENVYNKIAKINKVAKIDSIGIRASVKKLLQTTNNDQLL